MALNAKKDNGNYLYTFVEISERFDINQYQLNKIREENNTR